MMKKRGIQFLVLLLALASLLLFISPDYGFTGFAIFTDSGNSFNNGTFANTIYNGSSVVLSGTNSSGNYTSGIFDAGNLAAWNNLSFSGNSPSLEDLFVVDASQAVYYSEDFGVTWAEATSSYGGGSNAIDMFHDNSYLYIVFGGTSRDIWRSSDLGVSWDIVNNSFADSNLFLGATDSSGNLFVVDGSGDVYRSQDNGVTWTTRGDFNGGASNNPKGIAINSNGIFIVDGGGSVWKSSDSGSSWSEQNSSYGGSSGTDDLLSDDSDNLYILFNSAIYKSSDQGVSWSILNADYGGNQDGLTMNRDSQENLYIIDASGDFYNSSDSGSSWSLLSDFNGGATNNVKGLTNFILNSNLTYQYRNCSSADCSDASFRGPDGTENTYYTGLVNFDAESRYFQYKFYFSSSGSLVPYLDNVIIDYDLLATTPGVEILRPVKGTIFGTNESLALNFSVSGTNIDSCWYTLDSGVNNISIASCLNTTFDVGSSGSYVLALYANESVLGLTANDSVNFDVEIGAPEIDTIYPTNGQYVNRSPVNLTFNASSDLGLDTCELYGNFTGAYEFNQSASNFTSGEISAFWVDLTNGTYLWSVSCNNTQGVIGRTGNETFVLDTVAPEVNISEPNGTYNNTENIPLNYTVNDTSPLRQCSYNITFSLGGQVVGVGVIGDCNSTSVDVTTETSYDLELTAEDQAGNAGSSTTNFVVSSGGGGGGGGSGGGGGGSSGGSSGISGPAELDLTDLPVLNLRRGESELVSLEVLNSGSRFLNACKLSVIGPMRDWISNEQSFSIASGQKVNFVFAVNVPSSVAGEEYSSALVVECNEVKASTSLVLKVITSPFDFLVLSSTRDGTKLITTYSLQENTGKDQEVSLRYNLLNGDGLKVSEGIENVELLANERIERTLEIELPKDAEGNYVLSFEIAGDEGSIETEQPVTINRVTGLAVSDSNLRTLSFFGVILIVLGALVFVVRFIRKNYSKSTEKDNRKRELIPLKLK